MVKELRGITEETFLTVAYIREVGLEQLIEGICDPHREVAKPNPASVRDLVYRLTKRGLFKMDDSYLIEIDTLGVDMLQGYAIKADVRRTKEMRDILMDNDVSQEEKDKIRGELGYPSEEEAARKVSLYMASTLSEKDVEALRNIKRIESVAVAYGRDPNVFLGELQDRVIQRGETVSDAMRNLIL